jgi:putative FmdB family regulatory protein
MPTYRWVCEACDAELEIWLSIHDDAVPDHDCGAPLVKVFTPPRLYAIGVKGARTREVDAKEQVWSSDMAAYRAMRRQGLQPRGIDGAAQVEASAGSAFEIESGLSGIPEDRVTETFEAAREAGLV